MEFSTNGFWERSALTLATCVIAHLTARNIQHRQIKRPCFVKHTLAASMLISCLASPAVAAPFDDAAAAYGRGDYASALPLLRALAEQDNPEAEYDLGQMYMNGQGVPQNYTEAVKWWRKAAEHGVTSAEYNLGLAYEQGKGAPNDDIEALKWFGLAASLGNAKAQFALGAMFFDKKPGGPDYKHAMEWFRRAADQGLTAAQTELGVGYALGQGVPQDYVQAHMWLNLSAAQGDQDAVKNRDLIAPLMTPAQIAESQKLAHEWKPTTHPAQPSPVPSEQVNPQQQPDEEFDPQDPLAAIAREDVAPQFQIAATAYDKGDYATALRLFRPLADHGFSPAESILGIMYEQGRGVPHNFAEALKWFRLAAERNNSIAQLGLGAMYNKGEGVPQNHEEAMKWYRFAADQGIAMAQYNLGIGYYDGQGVLQDFVSAHMWFNLAAAQGYQGAEKNRDLAAQHMTPAQIAEAQKLARDWKPKLER
jgi:uncharacterized protein